jgi:CarD family transcriptional regulator
LRVPASPAHAASLRKLAGREVLAAALATLKEPPRPIRALWSRRAQEYLAKINTSNPEAFAEVVRDLQLAADGSASSFSQRNLFGLALDYRAGEFAAVNRITKPDAIALITKTLMETKTSI